MKRILSFALSALCLCACNNEMTESVIESETVNKVTVTVAPLNEQLETRTVLTKDNDNNTVFVWSDTDEIGIFPDSGSQVSFSMANGAGSSSAEFTGGGWGLKSSSTYAAYYPLIHDFDLDKTAIPLDYTGQTQNGNGNSDHLAAYDFMTAPASSPSNGTVNFNFGHLGTLLHFKFTIPEAAELTSIILKTNGSFIEKANLDLSSNKVTAIKSNTMQTLLLENVCVAANEVLDAYMMVSAVNLSGKALEATITRAAGDAYVVNLPAQNYIGGDVWNYTRSLTSSNAENNEYLSFTAMEDNCEIKLVDFGGNNPDVMISSDKVNWVILKHGETIMLNKDNTLYLKGNNPDGFSYGKNKLSRFVTRGQLFTQGNIMSLLYDDDFTENNSIPNNDCFHDLFAFTSIISAPKLPATIMTPSCYIGMFYGCPNLISAPKLPATELAYDCYEGMFEDCTSLISVPKLPAIKLAPYCYYWMFNGCTNLTKAPILPATELAEHCYASMFGNCTSLISAPDLPATSLVTKCYSEMFKDCTNLSSVKASFEYISEENSIENWLIGTSSNGTFYKSPNAKWTVSEAGIPDTWTVENY